MRLSECRWTANARVMTYGRGTPERKMRSESLSRFFTATEEKEMISAATRMGGKRAQINSQCQKIGGERRRFERQFRRRQARGEDYHNNTLLWKEEGREVCAAGEFSL